MAKAEIFHVVNNVTLDFESEGHKYLMKLLIENGMIILQDEAGKERFMFLGDEGESYTGSTTEPTVAKKPKKKRNKKKN